VTEKSIQVDQRNELAKKIKDIFLIQYAGKRPKNEQKDYSNVDFFFTKLRF